MKSEDGGPAFPLPDPMVMRSARESGMTLRDYFAAAALTGLLAAESENLVYKTDATAERFGGKTRQTKAAEEAYRQADAMLRARDSRGGEVR